MLVGIVALIISAIVVFNHQLVWLLAVFPGLYIAYAFFIAFSKAPALKDSIHLTHSEKEAWQKHHAFFRFPFAARSMAGALAMLQVVSVILAIAQAISSLYWALLPLLLLLVGCLSSQYVLLCDSSPLSAVE